MQVFFLAEFLGYSSAFGMTCMLLFTFTVVAKKFSIPCPLPVPDYFNSTNHTTPTHHHDDEHVEEQYCEPRAFNFNTRVNISRDDFFSNLWCFISMNAVCGSLSFRLWKSPALLFSNASNKILQRIFSHIDSVYWFKCGQMQLQNVFQAKFLPSKWKLRSIKWDWFS